MNTDRVDAATIASGERTPRARSSSRVRFDLDKNTELSPEAPRKPRFSDSDAAEPAEERRHRRRKHRDRDRGEDRGDKSDRRSRGSDLMNDKYERAPGRSGADEGESDGTEDLPDRFDSKGNKKGAGTGAEDPLNDLISGLASRFLSGQQGGRGEEEEGRRGRGRRH